MLTGHGTVAVGIEAMAEHAVDFLQKPAIIDELVSVIVAAAEQRRASAG
jgi:FixJ family two-component response regulator